VKECDVVKITVDEKGAIKGGHIPFRVIEEGNKEFWWYILNVLLDIAYDIANYLKEQFGVYDD